MLLLLELKSTMRSDLKCPICNKAPNIKRLEVVMTDGVSYNNALFDPTDPVILSDTEVYCSTDCYTRAVIIEEWASKQQ